VGHHISGAAGGRPLGHINTLFSKTIIVFLSKTLDPKYA